MNHKEFSAKGLTARREKATERRDKVAKLKSQGLSGTQIAEELDENPRTIYQDFAELKKARQPKEKRTAATVPNL